VGHAGAEARAADTGDEDANGGGGA